MEQKLKQRICIEFCVKLQISATKTFEMLNEAFPNDAPKRTTVFEWHSRFKAGRISIEDDPRQGRPKFQRTDENVQKITDLIKENPLTTLLELEQDTGISKTTIGRIVTEDLKLKKTPAKFIPRFLTNEPKLCRLATCEDMMEMTRTDPEWKDKIITGDETWVYGYDPEIKPQSAEWRGKRFEKKGQKNGTNGGWILHHDNARPHTAHLMTSFLSKNGTQILLQPPYFPDITPNDFFLFPKLKAVLKGRHFDTSDDIIEKSPLALKSIPKEAYKNYILKKAPDQDEPGFMYYFLSVVSDVAANRFINSSAIYFAPNMSFTPSYKGFFNKTLPLFAPRAFRADDYNDPFHLERISTLNTIEAADLGAVPKDSKSTNYTHDQYLINEWYTQWLPDLTTRHDSKTTYTVQITHANGTNETFIWHGPPLIITLFTIHPFILIPKLGRMATGPVKWSKPYFDCGRSNKWIFGATVPIPDIFPRHTGWRHIEIPTYVAVAVMEMDFDRIDINQCPLGNGNPPPNYFAGTAPLQE
ncbi:hypothetical protein LAZ67_5002460 [Cordylochernes scorpioides]|uniref:Mos1 transposase HTH domain-containing protein n=1 Tax=Cordylochernes scorpioides TaxID=51811 RepID=A0ABY6KL70_9ARAC|nr:hypothetical protein LAZ67_5002460 [Cordylochernes scorpioides]